MKFPRSTHRNIYVKSLRAGERVYGSVSRFVEDGLRLKVNKAKSAVDRPWRRKFLGFSFTEEETPRIRLAPETVKRCKEKVQKATKRNKGVSLESRIGKLNEYLRGWLNYFKLAEMPTALSDLDGWIRRRLRACLLKQWKLPKTRRKRLVSLGLSSGRAKRISGSRKGYWRLSISPQLNKALGLSYWREKGLFSLAENYRKYCQSL